MERKKQDQRSWRHRFTRVIKAAVPYVFAAAGLALGVGGVIENEPVAGACGAVAGVAAAGIQQRRARFHRDHVNALRERLRTHRLESDQTAAQLRQAVSSLQTELWQHRMVALATPAFGIQMTALTAQRAPAAAAANAPAADPAAATAPVADTSVPTKPREPFAEAS